MAYSFPAVKTLARMGLILTLVMIPQVLGAGECNLTCQGPDWNPCVEENFQTGAGFCRVWSDTTYDPFTGLGLLVGCETEPGPCAGSDYAYPIA